MPRLHKNTGKKRQKKTKETLKKKNCLMFISPLEKSVLKTTKRQQKIPKKCIEPGASLESIHDSMDLVQLTSAESGGSVHHNSLWSGRKETKMDPTKKRLDGEQNPAQKLKTT